jgi:predicted porin
LCFGCASFNNTDIVNTAFSAHDKILQIFWVGAKYAVTDDVDVMAGYYEYLQNSFGAGSPCSNATKATCSGMYNAFSLAADWRIAPKLEAYAGLMYQTANAGLANGFLHHDTVDPAVGFRFRF